MTISPSTQKRSAKRRLESLEMAKKIGFSQGLREVHGF
jgi:hypothetical protein